MKELYPSVLLLIIWSAGDRQAAFGWAEAEDLHGKSPSQAAQAAGSG